MGKRTSHAHARVSSARPRKISSPKYAGNELKRLGDIGGFNSTDYVPTLSVARSGYVTSLKRRYRYCYRRARATLAEPIARAKPVSLPFSLLPFPSPPCFSTLRRIGKINEIKRNDPLPNICIGKYDAAVSRERVRSDFRIVDE